MNHPISDFIIRIKNASLARRRQLILPYSKLNKEVGNVLVKQGFLKDCKEEVLEGRKIILATLRYEERIPVLSHVTLISKPSLRIYAKSSEIPQASKKGHATVIVSTSKGIMTDTEAAKNKVGGEILFKIW